MGAGRPFKCPVCTENVSKEDSIDYKGKHYHEKCFNKFAKAEKKELIKEKKEKQHIEQVKKDIQKDTHIINEIDLSDEDILAKDRLIKYLKELLNTKKLNAKIYKLLKDYFNTYKFSYEGMLITLKYYYEIQENPTMSDCVGIIPYVYDEAQEYENTKKEVNEYLNTININKIVTEKVVKIRKNASNINNKLIDINMIGGDNI